MTIFRMFDPNCTPDRRYCRYWMSEKEVGPAVHAGNYILINAPLCMSSTALLLLEDKCDMLPLEDAAFVRERIETVRRCSEDIEARMRLRFEKL